VLYLDGSGGNPARPDDELIRKADQIVIGPRGIAAGTVEIKHRRSGERQDVSVETALDRLTCS